MSSKRSTLSLQIEITPHIELLGLVSNESNYTLCWKLNETLATCFSDAGSYSYQKTKTTEPVEIPLFKYIDENDSQFFFFPNKIQHQVLVPEFKQIDYWLLLVLVGQKDVAADWCEQLRLHSEISYVALFDLATFKNHKWLPVQL